MWTKNDTKKFIDCMKTSFMVQKPKKSAYSNARTSVMNDMEHFMRMITPQILEMYEKGLSYETPKDWDESFIELGGGQARYRSKSILSKMSWEQFMLHIEDILSITIL